ncbi:hypothetical protein ACTGZQ_04625 [Streptococcus suis]
MKNNHVERVLDLQSDFYHLSVEIEALLYDSPDCEQKNRKLQENQDIKCRMENHINGYLDDLSAKTRIVQKEILDERDRLMDERNALPWE